jgi:hypothetical protein
MRGARARHFDSVRVQTEVCRVCGLHYGRGLGVELTPLKPKNGHPYSIQCWQGFQAISVPKNGKTATLTFGRRKGPVVNADPSVVCSQAMR